MAAKRKQVVGAGKTKVNKKCDSQSAKVKPNRGRARGSKEYSAKKKTAATPPVEEVKEDDDNNEEEDVDAVADDNNDDDDKLKMTVLTMLLIQLWSRKDKMMIAVTTKRSREPLILVELKHHSPNKT